MDILARTRELSEFYDLAAIEFDGSYRRASEATFEDRRYNFERDQIEEAVASQAHGAAVDVGAGTGYWLPRYIDQVRSVVLVEPSLGMRKQIERRVSSLRGLAPVKIIDGDHRDLGNNRFDFALVSGVLGHFERAGREDILSSVVASLVPGGTVLLIDSLWNPTAARLLPTRHGYATRVVAGQNRSVYKHYFESSELAELLEPHSLDRVEYVTGTYFWHASARKCA